MRTKFDSERSEESRQSVSDLDNPTLSAILAYPLPFVMRFLFTSLILFSATCVARGEKPLPSVPEKKTPVNTGWLKTITRIPPGPYAKIRPVELGFDLGWKNKINAGKFTISVKESKQNDQDVYLGEATGQTTGLARLLWPYDVQARSFVDHKTLRPKLFELKEKERNKVNDYKIRFESKKLVCNMTRINKKVNDGKPTTGVYQFHHDFVQDILSAIFYVRSQPLAQGEKVSLMIAPFNKPYLTKFQVTGREMHKLNKQKHKTIRLNVEISKILPDFSLGTYSKVKRITLWITDDEYRFPLELQAEVFVGYVTASLTSRKWLD